MYVPMLIIVMMPVLCMYKYSKNRRTNKRVRRGVGQKAGREQEGMRAKNTRRTWSTPLRAARADNQ